MNLKSNWWLLIGTILSQIWLASATSKKSLTLKQRLKKDVRSADSSRIKKVSLGIQSFFRSQNRFVSPEKVMRINPCFGLLRLPCVG